MIGATLAMSYSVFHVFPAEIATSSPVAWPRRVAGGGNGPWNARMRDQVEGRDSSSRRCFVAWASFLHAFHRYVGAVRLM